MQLLADGTYWGASCGQSSPATPLFRVARHAASLPEGRNSQSCTPRAGRGRKPDSRRAARISYRPHPSRPPHRYWIPGTVAGLHRGNRAIWRRGSRGATIRVRPLPLGPFAIVSRSFARETWHVRLHRETAKHLPCVEYPVSGEKGSFRTFSLPAGCCELVSGFRHTVFREVPSIGLGHGSIARYDVSRKWQRPAG